MYRVFLGAPTLSELENDPSSYSWRTIPSETSYSSSKSSSVSPESEKELQNVDGNNNEHSIAIGTIPDPEPKRTTQPISQPDESEIRIPGLSYRNDSSATKPQQILPLQPRQSTHSWNISLPFPQATLEAASRRISKMYESIVFNNTQSPDLELDRREESYESREIEEHKAESQYDVTGLGVSVFRGVEQTTLLSWPPTRRTEDTEDSLFRDSFVGPSFLLDNSSKDILNYSQAPPPQTFAESTRFFDTQNVNSQPYGNYSDASSIARFPSFHFNLHSLTSLTQLSTSGFKGSQKISGFLLAVLEVEGPDSVRIKRGADAGKDVSVFKIIMGDEEGTICKLTAWREIADEWGGNGKGTAAKRGDIVHIENVMAACEPTAAVTLTASPYLKSKLVICYRTMPYTHEDGGLRPDLRLGISEPSVRKVASMVNWFEKMAGLR